LTVSDIERRATVPQFDDVIGVYAMIWPCLGASLALIVNVFASASCPIDNFDAKGGKCRCVIERI